MSDAVITSKGQITIPKPVRDALGLEQGDRIEFVSTEEGFLIVPAKRDLRTLKGVLRGRRRSALSIDEMNAVIAQMGTRR